MREFTYLKNPQGNKRHKKQFLDRTALNKKYHYLLKALNFSAVQKEGVLASWGVESSTELTTDQLGSLCSYLEGLYRSSSKEWKEQEKSRKLDKARKRVLAVIAEYLRITEGTTASHYIKGIACRIAETDNYNKIPFERLQTIYNLFRNKIKMIRRSEEVFSDIPPTRMAKSWQSLSKAYPVSGEC